MSMQNQPNQDDKSSQTNDRQARIFEHSQLPPSTSQPISRPQATGFSNDHHEANYSHPTKKIFEAAQAGARFSTAKPLAKKLNYNSARGENISSHQDMADNSIPGPPQAASQSDISFDKKKLENDLEKKVQESAKKELKKNHEHSPQASSHVHNQPATKPTKNNRAKKKTADGGQTVQDQSAQKGPNRTTMSASRPRKKLGFLVRLWKYHKGALAGGAIGGGSLWAVGSAGASETWPAALSVLERMVA